MDAKRQNIVFLSIDCFRYDRCGFNGYSRSTTPFLDSLANESYVFDNAFATGPYTPESFPGILAGLHSKEEYFVEDIRCKAITAETPTLASHLSERGFNTFATVTNPHLSSNRNFDRGFDDYQNLRISDSKSHEENLKDSPTSLIGQVQNRLTQSIRTKLENQTQHPNIYTPLLILQRFKLLQDWPTVDASHVREAFIEQIKAVPESESFFGWLHLMDLHSPLHPRKYRDEDGDELKSKSTFAKYFSADGARISEIPHSRYGEFYDGVMRYVDQQIEQLVTKLKKHNQWENTILIVTGDHGEALSERGVYEHPWHHLFDELLKVPLLVRVPEADGGRVEQLFSLAWMHELIAEVAAIEPAPFPATSDTQQHLKPTDTDRTVVSDSVSVHGYSAAIRNSEHKFVEHRGESFPKNMIERYGEQVTYRISRDKGESVPLSAETAPKALRKQVNDYHVSPDDVLSLELALGSEATNRLSQLGYISK